MIKKSSIVLCVSIVLFLSITSIGVFAFNDVPSNHYAYDAIDVITQKGIMSGNNGSFYPSSDVTREMVVTSLCKFINEAPLYNTNIPFTDVSGPSAGYVAWAYEKGITSGTSSTTFSPYQKITRQELCLMICNLYSYYDISFVSLRTGFNFADASEISSWARPAVRALYYNKIVDGDTNGNFRPKDNVSKAQLAVIFKALYDKIFFLPVTPVDQGNNNWCWAATASTVGSYGVNNPPKSMESIVTYVKGSLVNDGGDISDIIKALNYSSNFTKSYTYDNNYYSFPLVQRSIWYDFEPLHFSGEVIYGDDRHSMTIFGYVAEKEYVFYVNPNDATYNAYKQGVTHTQLKNGSIEPYIWDRTYYCN